MLYRDEAPPPAPPSRLGEFRIVRELGRGGMGVVYLAEQERLKRRVALKVLPLAAVSSAVAVRRFLQEAELIASLRHENIVQVFASGQEQGCLYYAMEYVEGESLRGRLARGIEPVDAARIARDVARALEHAHGHGIVHRDIKPENILLDSQGCARLADFGIARGNASEAITATGALLGTPMYMSPEQATRNGTVGPASDVYSLGVVLYEALTGRPVVSPEKALDEQFRQVREDDPTPHPKLPRELGWVVARCTVKDVARRYPSAREPAEDLERFLRGEAVLARAPSATYRLSRAVRRHRVAVTTAGVIAAAAAAVLVWWFTRPGRLTVEVDPSDATVWIDETPRRDLRARGAHRVRVVRDGYETADLSVVLARGETRTLPIRLRRMRRRILLETEPFDARVVLLPKSGAPVHRTAPIDEEFDADEYEVVFEKEGRHRKRLRTDLRERPWTSRVYLPPALLWTARLGQASLAAVGDGAVALCAESGEIAILNAADGRALGTVSSVGRYPSPRLVRLDGTRLLWIAMDDGRMRLLNWPDGRERWSYVPESLDRRAEEVWWPATGECWLLRSSEVEAVDARTGKLARRFALEPGRILPLDDEGRYAHQMLDRIAVRRAPAEELASAATPRFAGGHLAAADLDGDGAGEAIVSYRDGTVRAFRLEPLGEIWRVEVGAPSAPFAVGVLRPGERPSVVVLSEDRLTVIDSAGRFRASKRVAAARSCPALADAEGDGTRELFYASEDALLVVDPLSLVTIAEIPLPSPPARHLAITELNGDGLLDAVVPLGNGGVVALAGAKTVWEFKTGHSVRRAPACADLDGDGTPDVVCTSLDQHAYAIDGRGGRLLWKIPLGNQAATTPLIVGGDVVVAAWGGRALRLRGKTGETMWSYRPNAEHHLVSFHASPVSAEIDGRPAILLADWRDDPDHRESQEGAVHCLDAETGSVRWVTKVGAPFAAAPALQSSERIVVADILGGMTCLDLQGKILWSSQVPGGRFFAEAVRAPEGALAWPVADAGIIAVVLPGESSPRRLEIASSAVAWARTPSGPTAVFAGSGAIQTTDWKVAVTKPIAALVAADLDGDGVDEILVAEVEGGVTCFSVDGERRWRFEAGTTLEALPVATGSEVILAGGDGRVIVLHGRGRTWTGAWEGVGGDRCGTATK